LRIIEWVVKFYITTLLKTAQFFGSYFLALPVLVLMNGLRIA